MKRRHLVTLSIIIALAASACGRGGDASANNGSRTLTVWLMEGDLSDQAVAAINKRFERSTGAKVDVATQQWDNINTKISTALAQDDPPDVIEIGNTNVPLFAATGALSDLTEHREELSGGQSWLDGLAGPATIDGRLYAAPLFAGNRAVIYNKSIWAEAGITEPPSSFDELTRDLDKIKKGNTARDFSAFYFPGRYWYGALQFVWDAGGQIAVKSGGKWRGTLESSRAQRGLRTWKKFQNTYSTSASRNVDTKKPDQAALFADGKTSAILDTSIKTILKDKPSLKGKIGTFPFPSRTAGKTQPVFLGGSDLAIAAKSEEQDLALAYLKVATSRRVQKKVVVGIDGWTPISAELIDQVSPSLPKTSTAFFTAAKTSVATPATPGWATVETDKSINGFFADIATGRKSIAEATKAFDAHLDKALNSIGK